ncbi:hypothetical protein U1Q18_049888, partial [Sarracenia purpurea var. burkii]
VERCGVSVHEEATPDANDVEANEQVITPEEPLAACSATVERDPLEVSDLDSPPHSPCLGLHTRVHSSANRTSKK